MATTVDKPFKKSGGPVIDVKVASTSDPYVRGSIMSFDASGFAIPAAANSQIVGLVIDSYVDSAGDTYVRLDVGGAIALGVVYTSATDVGTPVKIVDNFEVADRSTDEEYQCGVVARVVSTNVADILLSHAASMSGAS